MSVGMPSRRLLVELLINMNGRSSPMAIPNVINASALADLSTRYTPSLAA